MAYEISIEERDAYIYARVTGTNTAEDIIAYMRDLVARIEAIGCFRVLLHECLEGPRLGTVELFETISRVSQDVLGKFDTIAYVDEEIGDLRVFGESVAVNRGMPLAAFTDLCKAVCWISKQTETSDGRQIFLADSEDER